MSTDVKHRPGRKKKRLLNKNILRHRGYFFNTPWGGFLEPALCSDGDWEFKDVLVLGGE